VAYVTWSLKLLVISFSDDGVDKGDWRHLIKIAESRVFTLAKRDARIRSSLFRFSRISKMDSGPRQNPRPRITYFHKEFSRSTKASNFLLNARLTGASGKRTIWRLRRIEKENGEMRNKSACDSVERKREKEWNENGGGQERRESRRVGWACQLVDILNGKLPRPSLQSAATSEERERNAAKKKTAHVYVYAECSRNFWRFS